MSDTRINPRRAVIDAPFPMLLEAWSDTEGYVLYDDDCGVRFVCPRCGIDKFNPKALMDADGWRWRCYSCRFHGTRAMLERLVLENADALGRLLELRDEVPR